MSTVLLSEEVFQWSDFMPEAPELKIVALAFGHEEVPPYDPDQDPVLRFIRLLIILLGVGQLAGVWSLSDRTELPVVALGFLGLSGVVILFDGIQVSARTLRRILTRDPQSLDAR